MKLVIDISEGLYEWIKSEYKNPNGEVVYVAIANGTPLPKKHGRLIDANDIDKILRPIEKGDDERAVTFETAIRLIHDALNRMPTIIEADKTEKEDKVTYDEQRSY